MWRFLHDGDLQAPFRQIFSHFKPDKACTDDDSFFWMIVQGRHNFIEIGNIAKRVGILSFCQTFNGRNKRFSSWREDQLVVAFCEFLSMVSRVRTINTLLALLIDCSAMCTKFINTVPGGVS